MVLSLDLPVLRVLNTLSWKKFSTSLFKILPYSSGSGAVTLGLQEERAITVRCNHLMTDRYTITV
jgi:hypothetical protein